LNVLLTVHQFFPEYRSGTEVLTLSVARELRRLGHQVAVFTGFPESASLQDNERFDEYALEGIRVFRFRHAAVPMGGQRTLMEIEYCNLLAARHFEKLIADFVPDIIHFFHLARLGAGLMDVAFAAGIPSYLTATDFWSVCPTSQLLLDDGSMCPGPTRHAGNCLAHIARVNRRGLARQIARWVPEGVIDAVAGLTTNKLLPVYPFSHQIAALGRRQEFIAQRLNGLDRILAPTQLMADLLIAHGIDPARIQKTGFGIDTGAYDGYSCDTSDRNELVVGFIGTLAPHKGCQVLLQAVAGLGKENIKTRIYGNASEFPEYFAKLSELAGGDPAIEFCGTFPNERIAEVLGGIDVLVVPSLWYENTPLVVYSALASACPVVASDFAGISEAISNEVNGLLFSPGNVGQLREKLLALRRQPDLLARLRANCRRPKSTQEYVGELLALYAEGLGRHAAAAQPAGMAPAIGTIADA
jgi:glycosyltransferase involved in cell wall biosynthesis